MKARILSRSEWYLFENLWYASAFWAGVKKVKIELKMADTKAESEVRKGDNEVRDSKKLGLECVAALNP